MTYHEAFDGAVCMDAMEMVYPEDWQLVLMNCSRALRPAGYLYFTVELLAEQELENAFAAGKQAGYPMYMGNGRMKVGIITTQRSSRSKPGCGRLAFAWWMRPSGMITIIFLVVKASDESDA